MSKERKLQSLVDLEEALDEDLLLGPLKLAEDKLRQAGLDPAGVRASGSQFVHDLREKQRLAWQVDARARLAKGRKLIAEVDDLPTDRESLLVLVDQARSDPRYANQIEMAFRDRSAEEADVDELVGLLEDIRVLEQLENDE